MNVKIKIWVQEKDEEKIQPLIDELADTLVSLGYWTDIDDEDAPVKSIISVGYQNIETEEDATHWIVDEVLEEGHQVTIPAKTKEIEITCQKKSSPS